ncbi:MAG TPA: TraR/DksA C4-type zinc finger protein [Paludibaculum sp.]
MGNSSVNTGDREQEEKQELLGDKTMTKTELNKYKQILETKLTELSQAVRDRDGIAIEKSPDALDEVQHAAERELAIRNLDRESHLLRNVRGALRRIDEGAFGVCLHCEEDINPKRLNAVPWTPFCIQCQELADRNRVENSEMFEELMVA